MYFTSNISSYESPLGNRSFTPGFYVMIFFPGSPVMGVTCYLVVWHCFNFSVTTCFRQLAPVFHTSKFFYSSFLSIYLTNLLFSSKYLSFDCTNNDGYYGEQDQMMGRFFLFILFLYLSIELIF